MFQLLQTDDKTRARRGRLTTAHGVIETPAFMPVGTQGSVKAVSPRELRQLEAQVILGNTYHLFVRPGMEVIRQFGGLHRFMSWNAPILTDSGGYQIFSLAKLRRIIEEGVHFQNHLDGSPAFISPEIAMEIQATLGSDIAMVLDECPPWPCEREYAARSLEMTIRWARRCKAAAQRGTEENVERRTSNVEGQSSEAALIDDEASTSNQLLLGSERGTEASVRRSTSNFQRPTSKSINHQPSTLNQLLFGIVQGGTFADLRRESAEALVEIGFDGYAIGGVSVGEPEPEMMNAVENSELYLPPDKPRYAMGLGTPPQLIELIGRGVDMFDCVLPTRLARNGTAFTAEGTLNLKNAEFTLDQAPVEAGCSCPACREFSRGYIRHLLKAEEILGLRLITLHNLHFYLALMRRARAALEGGAFSEFKTDFLKGYRVERSAPGK
ncbi:MAG: tRNA guanosine(34) transglycosylase Tgt [Verrucomicrobiota bacterium]|nr:tRNA guanosine(34) transglycosylase Tgt [Verrucomicrobiota bacterium]